MNANQLELGVQRSQMQSKYILEPIFTLSASHSLHHHEHSAR